MNSYLITGFLILANGRSSVSSENGMQRYRRYTEAMQKNEQFNDFSNTFLTTLVDIVVRKLWYSKRRLNGYRFHHCCSCDLQIKARIKHKFAIKIVIIHNTLANKPTTPANTQ